MNIFKKLRSFYKSKSNDNIYSFYGAVPIKKAIPFGLQHVLAMFIANITPILIVYGLSSIDASIKANAIRSAILFAGIGTLIQLFPIWKVGSKLPIVVGVSFTFVGVLSQVLLQYGYGSMITSIIIGGVFIGILGLFSKYWTKFITPIVSSSVVLAIGLSLLGVGATSFFGGSNLFSGTYDFSSNWPLILIASFSLLASTLWFFLCKGIWKNISILVGLVLGLALSLILNIWFNIIDFSVLNVSSVTDIINVPRLVDFSSLKFDATAIIVVCIIYLVASTEGIGDMNGIAYGGFNREPTQKEISGGITCDGFISAIGGLFGSLPLTTFSQNVSIVSQTKVVNRFSISLGAIFLILCSFFPILANFILLIPEAVLGGVMITLFAQIVVIAMQMISKAGFTTKNIFIISLSVGLGYGITLLGDNFFSTIPTYISLIISNPVINMFVISLVLSLLIKEKKIDSTSAPKTEEDSTINTSL
ncbi:MAG: hypothetical protein LBV51_03805 [Acholeplasmatales bacterium]|nr:hypothetical protein [Acholeplasmatales bacterium]